MTTIFTTFATRKDGTRVEVGRSIRYQNLLDLKRLLVMRSEEFDETTRLVQKHREMEEQKSGV